MRARQSLELHLERPGQRELMPGLLGPLQKFGLREVGRKFRERVADMRYGLSTGTLGFGKCDDPFLHRPADGAITRAPRGVPGAIRPP